MAASSRKYVKVVELCLQWLPITVWETEHKRIFWEIRDLDVNKLIENGCVRVARLINKYRGIVTVKV
jgi:hypothetical protein